MTVEDLMKRRVIVENLYPGCEFEVNEILYVNDKGTIDVYEDWGKWELEFKNYPYLFRELNWWEERYEKDMPEFVKSSKDGTVLDYKSASALAMMADVFDSFIAQSLPATKEEYENQQK